MKKKNFGMKFIGFMWTPSIMGKYILYMCVRNDIFLIKKEVKNLYSNLT